MAEDAKDDDDDAAEADAAEARHALEGRGPCRPVRVDLEPELVESLPLLTLSEVRDPRVEHEGRLLPSHDWIVYDVTEFADHHPGGRDLLLTAAGLDLGHFFDNYTAHGESDKAAVWLAAMAAGRLSDADARLARESTDSAAHVERRRRLLGCARRRVLLVAATLPLWMAACGCVRLVGRLLPPLGRLLARLLPVSVPGLTAGAERLEAREDGGEGDGAPSVAVIGGGIAGCGAAWALRRSGFRVTLYEARAEASGNARTFDWDFSAHRPGAAEDERTVRSCCSVTAWPSLFYKNYTCLLEELRVETVHQPLSEVILERGRP